MTTVQLYHPARRIVGGYRPLHIGAQELVGFAGQGQGWCHKVSAFDPILKEVDSMRKVVSRAYRDAFAASSAYSSSSAGSGCTANIAGICRSLWRSPARPAQSVINSSERSIADAGAPAMITIASMRSGESKGRYCTKRPLMLKPTLTNLRAFAASATANASLAKGPHPASATNAVGGTGTGNECRGLAKGARFRAV